MILSLDLSTKSSGYAVLDIDGKLLDYGCETSASTDLIKRIYIMRDAIDTILQKYPNITKVIAEEVRPQGGYGVGNQKTQKALMYLQAAFEFLIHDKYPKIEIEYIQPSSWRAALGIKNGRGVTRTTLKEADMTFIKEKFNIDVNDDIADAICIGLAIINKLDLEDKGYNWG